MRSRLLTVALMSLPLFAAACAGEDDLASPYDGDFPVSDDNVNAGAPDNGSLPDDNKADAQYPVKFEIDSQSPVKSQGGRGVCSIFASTAMVENLYIKAGMPVADADFSEQYLQWSAKNLQGAFKNTEGSNADDNLEAVVTYGTIKEREWAYESTKWGPSNDPACVADGEGLPTKCYTNGEPPASVAMAQKFKLPSTRWINNNSIKAHITAKKTGVNVGMTFFYQSWNHRRSTIPVDAALWRKGIVTYPNAKDKTESATHRAGHAIHIIGWDDELSVPMRDGEGKPVLDANGQPKMEKGFWLFKNSWGTGSFGVENEYGDGYGWLSYQYVKEFGSAVVAEVPVLGGGVAEVCDDAASKDEDTDGKANCADTDCAMHPSCSGGGSAHNYAATPAAAIPDNSATGVSSTINVTDAGTITDAKLTVDITHPYRGDLKVTLTKGTQSIVIFNGDGGSADDLKQTFPVAGLVGKALAGGYTLKVEDTAATDTGKLNTWSLEIAAR